MIHDTIHVESDVTRFWRSFLGPLEFDRTQLFLAVVDDDGAVLHHLSVVEQNPRRPEEAVMDAWAREVREFYVRRAPRGTAAVLWARPGRGPMRADDRAWLREASRALRRNRVPTWPAHFANEAFLRPVAPDELTA